VYTLFNKHGRKFKKRKRQRQRRKINSDELKKEVANRILGYKKLDFARTIRIYLMSLPKHKMKVTVDVVEKLVFEKKVPTRILMLVKDLMAYRHRSKFAVGMNNTVKVEGDRCYMNVLFHNKGMDMIGLPKILNSKRVMAALPAHLRGPPPIVSYTYTKTIAGKIFNNRKVVDELDMDRRTDDMECSCSSSEYVYKPCAHVVTGNLNIKKRC